MSLTHKGITPTLVVDTTPLQNEVQVAGTKWRKGSDGRLTATTGNEGICATLTAFWLTARAEGRMITHLSDFPNRFALSIAQSAYENSGTGMSRTATGDDTGIITRYGLKSLASTAKKRKWYMWKTTRIEQVAKAAVGWPGYYYIVIQGDGGHAIGIASKGQVQFFDPNEGIMDFTSGKALSTWLPAYVKSDYPNLLKRVEFYAVGL